MTIETEEKTLLRGSQGQHPTLMWCPSCRRQVEMVTPERAAQIAGVSERMVHDWIEARSVHFLEGRGDLWICVAALSQRRKK